MSSTKQDKPFALADCDNFYVSCERLFQPKYKSTPVVVLSNNDGCIVARSPEVKALGVGMGKPFYEFKDIIERHKVKVFSSNYTLYGDISRRVMETLKGLAAQVEVYSIDEAFLILGTNEGLKLGKHIRRKVLKNIGIPLTIGIGQTKTLAKIAAEYAKKRGDGQSVFDLYSCLKPDEILESVLVQDIWGVGLKTAEWLYQRGINTALDLKRINDETIRKRAGVVGLRTVYELRGISCIELRALNAPKKGITSSRSFGRYVTALKDLEESIATHATIAGEKLRKDNSVAGEISAFITTNVYSNNPQYGKSLPISIHPPSSATNELIKPALAALRKIYKPGYRYIKAGVMLNKISPASQRQIDMFVPRDVEKEEQIYRSVDRINLFFGSNTIRPASCGIKQNWKMKQDFNSPRFTTKWEELPVARI
ncbi:MAG: Y-family DNA polymerase [Candidatus Zixiibacteriota bacterium]